MTVREYFDRAFYGDPDGLTLTAADAAALVDAAVAAERKRLLPFVRACGGKGLPPFGTRAAALVELGYWTPEQAAAAEAEIRANLERLGGGSSPPEPLDFDCRNEPDVARAATPVAFAAGVAAERDRCAALARGLSLCGGCRVAKRRLVADIADGVGAEPAGGPT